jgi:heme/copper-type cytochrome/quinol oxidase subunit 3
MATTTVDAPPATTTPVVGTADRRNLAMVGSFLAIAAGTMLIGGLLGAWLAAREEALAAGSPWLRDGFDIPNVPVAVTFFTLLMSSFTAQWAVHAAKIGDRKSVYLAIGVTLVLGLSFVNGMSFVFDEVGLEAGLTDVATSTYAVTVTHLLLVVAAHVLFLVMGFRSLTRAISPSNHEQIAAAAAFWHFTVVAGGFVYLVVWFLEGSPA